MQENRTGLSSSEANEQLAKFGMNEIISLKQKNLVDKALNILREPIFILLFIAALVYFFLQEFADGFTMLAFVFFIAGINIFQEWRTDKAIDKLKELSSPEIIVLRDGKEILLSTKLIVPGDVMVLNEGDVVPADGEIIKCNDFAVNESTLTGEPELVWKEGVPTEEKQWRLDYCYTGTLVINGTAKVYVTATGINTEYGKIGQSLEKDHGFLSPLQRQTKSLIQKCTFISLALMVIVVLIILLNGQSITTAILAGITLAMATLPEEFPVILTVFLAMGAWRLTAKKALVRNLNAIETLGAINVLCVDKTGTLTENKMYCARVIGFEGNDKETTVFYAALACETKPYDPMEKAILQRAENMDIDVEALHSNTLLHEYPFRSDTKIMGHVWQLENDIVATIKGAPESVLPRCNISDTSYIEKVQNSLAENSYRVLAIANRYITDEAIPENLDDLKLDFVGLLAFNDPPRTNIKEDITICKEAGIKIIMITGDNSLTARSIAEVTGIIPMTEELIAAMPLDADPNQDFEPVIITGKEIETLSEKALGEKLKNSNICSRVMPSHKMKIVEALQATNQIVAMTGDGVNDAPALKQANVGIAMGQCGTQVAREASDIVLLDDRFQTIVETIKDGRRIFDNISKATGYVFVAHIPIIFLALFSAIFNLPPLLLPIHVVLLELIIDPTCSIVFAEQPAEENIMSRPPRDINESILTPNLLARVSLQGVVIFFVTFIPYVVLLKLEHPAEVARACALFILLFCNLFLVYSIRSRDLFFVSILKNSDSLISWIINFAIILIAFLMLQFEPLSRLLQTAPLSWDILFFSFILAIIGGLWWEAIKFWQK